MAETSLVRSQKGYWRWPLCELIQMTSLKSSRLRGVYIAISPRRLRSVAGCASVDAHRARAEVDDLQQAAGEHHVLEEMDHLVLIGEVAMEEDGGRQGEKRECQRNDARAVARNEECPAAQFHDDGDEPSQLGERYANAADVSDGRVVRSELAQSTKHEWSADQLGRAQEDNESLVPLFVSDGLAWPAQEDYARNSLRFRRAPGEDYCRK